MPTSLIDFQKICDALPFAILICDAQQLVIYMNHHAQNAFGDDVTLQCPLPVYIANKLQMFFGDQQERAYIALEDTTHAIYNDFVANVSHELRTPLAAVLGIVETLQNGAKDDPQAMERFLPLMQSQTRRMTKLVNGLLGLVSDEKKRHISPSTILDLTLVAREALASVQMIHNERVFIDSLGNTSLPVYGDHDDLVRVVQNLLENALKYGYAHTPVTLGLPSTHAVAPNMVGISIYDQGVGIAEHVLPRLTERFYRVDASRARQGISGAGLGLALVKSILTRHHGVLVPQSVLNKGSEFTIWLPCAVHNSS